MNQQEQAISDTLIAKRSPRDFIRNFCYLENPHNFSRERFLPYDYQDEILDWWMGNRLTIILKARQLGISWLATAFALWLANFHSNVQIVCISRDEKKAWKLIDKVKYMYDNLPEHLKKPLNVRNRGELRWEDGSYIQALPSNPGNAVSFTASLIIVDEWAEQEYAEEMYKALKPTIDGSGGVGGRLIGISTGSYVGTFFHAMWDAAKKGDSGFAYKFLGYDLRPGRDEAWYNQAKRDYTNERDFYQQYPRNETEAFIAAGGCPFTPEDIEWYMQTYVAEPIPMGKLIKLNSRGEDVNARVPFLYYKGTDSFPHNFLETEELQIWELPQAGEEYIASLDPATGQDGKDYHATQIIKLSSLEQVAELNTRCDIGVYTALSCEMAKTYFGAEMVVERNNTGYTVIYILLNQIFYDRVYQHVDMEDRHRKRVSRYRPSRRQQTTEEERRKHGWPASTPNKSMRDLKLIEAVREHGVIIHSERWWQQAQGFVRHPDGGYGSMGSAFDDLITSFGMGYLIALERRGGTQQSSPIRLRTTRRRAFRREKWR